MPRRIVIRVIILTAIVGIGAFLFFRGQREDVPQRLVPIPAAPTFMNIASIAFVPEGAIPSVYTCDGRNVSPPLAFSDVPPNAESLALVVDDPDAPVAGGWVHWIVWNIPPSAAGIPEAAAPPGAEGTTSFGKPGYGGPCPPSGTHRYFFKLYALNNTLDLSASTTRDELEKAFAGKIIQQAELMGTYTRSR